MCVSASMTLTWSRGSAMGNLLLMRCTGLGVLGEAEIEASVARVEPAARHHLATGEEMDAVGSVGVGVAEERALPPAERVVRDGNRDGNVDPDHADLDLVLEAPGRAAVVGEDRRAVAVRIRVHQRER